MKQICITLTKFNEVVKKITQMLKHTSPDKYKHNTIDINQNNIVFIYYWPFFFIITNQIQILDFKMLT